MLIHSLQIEEKHGTIEGILHLIGQINLKMYTIKVNAI